MSDENRIVYWTERLPDGRGQLRRDIIVHDRRLTALCGAIGPPGPLDAVRSREHTVTLEGDATDEDLGDVMLLESLTWEE